MIHNAGLAKNQRGLVDLGFALSAARTAIKHGGAERKTNMIFHIIYLSAHLISYLARKKTKVLFSNHWYNS
jgi:hypothetical protein